MSDLKNMLAGKFLVIDGPDGAGKSTQIRLLASHLRQEGCDVCQVCDPGGTAIGDRIRAILLDRDCEQMDVSCELMLYMASRAQLASEVIRPALSAGRCVLCDRYISATVAYQGAGGIDAETVLSAGRMAVGATWPDLTVILNVPAEVGLTRLAGTPDRMESKDVVFHRKVRQLFLQQAEQQPGKFLVVDASGDQEQVQGRLRQTIVEHFEDGHRF